MNIERVELATELLRKSGQVDFYINKEVYEYNNLKEIVNKLKKQYGLTVKIVFKDKVRITAKVGQ